MLYKCSYLFPLFCKMITGIPFGESKRCRNWTLALFWLLELATVGTFAEYSSKATSKGRTLCTISSSNRLDKAASLALDASDIDDRIDDLILLCVSTAVFSCNDTWICFKGKHFSSKLRGRTPTDILRFWWDPRICWSIRRIRVPLGQLQYTWHVPHVSL